ncbi:acyl-CoA N-acyltransferase [Cucurbitaria berberidis CBS 394.84]|uniref:Acyl-CoA N-acyltransferase n=1 Tax=Cucurbitaria berberidis CBS 394.84 TaxID=1168544 RepID=A0A9P4LD35_9PLEO|nr:acyl-CoA N-acyltransferase [Cucurbitaria berberidis CBS 394.84]KAF1850640.1 acyl-CoA N-acyltransferase [Cucurbitaria berberidis CBS 394.84]
MRIRACRKTDLPAIRTILEYYVLNTVITLALTPPTCDQVRESWHNATSHGLPYLVAVQDDPDNVLGFGYAGEFRGGGGRGGYRHTVELSLFCHPDHMKKGIGSRLLQQLIEILKAPERFPDYVSVSRKEDDKVRMLLACMSVDEKTWGGGLGLRDFYVKHGFDEVGHMNKVGHKFNRWCVAPIYAHKLGWLPSTLTVGG